MGVVVIGGGGHGAVVIEALAAMGRTVAAVVDSAPSADDVLGVLVAGGDEMLPRLRAEGHEEAVVAVGSVRPGILRERLAEAATEAGFRLVKVVHPTAVVSPSAVLEEGVFVAAGAIVGPRTTIGRCCIVNTNAVVDHDCVLGPFTHVAPGATLSGSVSVGSHSHLGTGVSVTNGVRIGSNVLVGIGAAVIGDVGDGVVVHGVPAQEVGDGGA